jgi:hypothetical protein
VSSFSHDGNRIQPGMMKDADEQAGLVPELLSAPALPVPASPAPRLQSVLIFLGVVAFLYFARPVVLPVVLACVAEMAGGM